MFDYLVQKYQPNEIFILPVLAKFNIFSYSQDEEGHVNGSDI